jgi:hypothetical protein
MHDLSAGKVRDFYERNGNMGGSGFSTIALDTAEFPALLDDNLRPSTLHTIASIAPH